MTEPRQHSIPFSRPRLLGNEAETLSEVFRAGKLAGNGPFTRRCNDMLTRITGTGQALITTSGSTALDMAALITGLVPGDEVIIPSFTFVSTANAVVLRGAIPIFVDIREDTLNLDETKVEKAITQRTKAIVPVHYAGVGCEMDEIVPIVEKHGLTLIEDAAQAIDATYNGQVLGTIGGLGALSFHQTKNISSGEGGALLVNDPALTETAKVAWDKGTNRSAFLDGQVPSYEWIDAGSSYLPSEITAALLVTQFDTLSHATERRLALWNRYQDQLADIERYGYRCPRVPSHCGHNAHTYFVICPDHERREQAIAELFSEGIGSAAHYPPLHLSKGGKRYGRVPAPCPVSEDVALRLLRLPLYDGLEAKHIDRVVISLMNFIVQG